ncbi:MAG: ABC transporter substrate-binding protein, partial [Firmicutes bacterium]|nr:ABC transporter substrate-binding protein [Bacillota bacterium]
MRRRTLILGTLALLAALLAAGAVRFVVLRPKPVPFFIAAEEPRPEYLPVYLADHLGYLRAENLAPTFVSGRDLPPGAPGVWLVDLTDFLLRGAAGGPDGVVVAVLGARPALYLLSTARDPEFRVSRLKGSSVLTGEPLSVPETQFACVLQAHGLHLFRDVTPIPNLPPELHVGALEARIAAYLVSPEPRTTLLTAGGLHVVASLGAALGDFPAAVAVAPRPCLADQREALAAFVRALYRAQLYLSHYGPSDAAPALARFFPDLEP